MKYILVPALLFLLTACSSDEQKTTSVQSASNTPKQTASVTILPGGAETPAYKLVFFIDPNGGPCRMQDTILNDMAGELKGKVGIQYVQTTVPADRDIFYQYGIRALPTLLLADAGGKEIKRMTPGVKSADDIRLLLQSIPQT